MKDRLSSNHIYPKPQNKLHSLTNSWFHSWFQKKINRDNFIRLLKKIELLYLKKGNSKNSNKDLTKKNIY